MAATQADALIERTKVIVGRATATSFLGDTGDRHFVVEAVLTWAAILLLETYLSGGSPRATATASEVSDLFDVDVSL